MNSVATPGLWALFGSSVIGLLALDLFVFHHKSHTVRTREAVAWSIAWIALAVLFSGTVYLWFGSKQGLEFLTGYIIEKALAVDNLFIFAVILTYFGIPARRQHRVLFSQPTSPAADPSTERLSQDSLWCPLVVARK